MNNKKIIFTFRNYDWMLATTFEIINEELNNESTIFWAHWAENLNFPREFLISEKIKNVRMKKRVFNSNLIDKLNKNSKPTNNWNTRFCFFCLITTKVGIRAIAKKLDTKFGLPNVAIIPLVFESQP